MKPQFMNANYDFEKSVCSDGTKSCFMFSRYDTIDEFSKQLEEKIKEKVTRDSYLGYKILYVPAQKYEEAVIEGLKLILNNSSYRKSGVTWINYYNEKTPWGYVQILEFNLHKNKMASNGGWKKSTERRVKRWAKKLENILEVEVEVYEYLGKARITVPRTTNSHLEHDTILNKIRKNQTIFENTPFNEYAMLDYFGKFIKL